MPTFTCIISLFYLFLEHIGLSIHLSICMNTVSKEMLHSNFTKAWFVIRGIA